MKTIYPQATLDKLAEIDRCIDIVVKNNLPTPPQTATELVDYVRNIERCQKEAYEKIKPLCEMKAKVLSESIPTFLVGVNEVKGDKE